MMPIPDYQTLMLPLLKRAAKKEVRVPEISDEIADEFGLTQTERGWLLPSGRQKDSLQSPPLGQVLSKQSSARCFGRTEPLQSYRCWAGAIIPQSGSHRQ
jgi:hypothetical protein